MIRARSTSRTVAVARLTRTTSTERSASGSTAGSDIPMSTDGAAPTPAPQAYRELQTPSTSTPAVDLLIMKGQRLGGDSGWHGRGVGVVAAIGTRPPDRWVDVLVRRPGG